MLVYLCLGLSFGLIDGMALSTASDIGSSRMYVLAVVLTFAMVGVIASLTGRLNTWHAAAATPLEPLRQDLVFAAVGALSVTAIGTASDWAINWATSTEQQPADTKAAFWLTAGLLNWAVLGAGFGLTVWSRARMRYTLAIGLLAARGRLPLRTGEFLSWAQHAGLLRTSGTAYQYRHRQFQDWITPAAPRPSPAQPEEVVGQPEQVVGETAAGSSSVGLPA
jgi:hypothetical protein